MATNHQHREIKGRMTVQGAKGINVTAASAENTPEISTGYAKGVMHVCSNNKRPTSESKTEVTELTKNSTVVHSLTLEPCPLVGLVIVAVMPSGGTDVYGEKLKERSIQKTDQYSKVTPPEEIANIPKLDTYYGNSQPLTRAQEKEKETAHRSRCDAAEKVWNKIAQEKKFDEI